jgi:hypothetical protein
MIFFNIFISIIVVAGFGDIVTKFAAANIKTPIINIFLAHDIRPITKNLIFSVIE